MGQAFSLCLCPTLLGLLIYLGAKWFKSRLVFRVWGLLFCAVSAALIINFYLKEKEFSLDISRIYEAGRGKLVDFRPGHYFVTFTEGSGYIDNYYAGILCDNGDTLISEIRQDFYAPTYKKQVKLFDDVVLYKTREGRESGGDDGACENYLVEPKTILSDSDKLGILKHAALYRLNLFGLIWIFIAVCVVWNLDLTKKNDH